MSSRAMNISCPPGITVILKQLNLEAKNKSNHTMDFIHGPCGNLKSTQEINKKLLSSPPQDGGQEDQGHV